MSKPMVIVGAGQAGLQTAEALRAEGWEGGILLLGAEPHAPYHRPPLSKAYMLGEYSEAQLTIRGPEALAKKSIELRTGTRVASVDRAAGEVVLAGGGRIAYQGLALATGSRPRPLPFEGGTLPGVFPLRTLDDCKAISAALEQAEGVAVIGGGFIGLEFAAVARKKGRPVVVFEAADRLMARVVAPLISDFYAELHRKNGVELYLGAHVSGIAGRDGHAFAVRSGTGVDFVADLIIAGIGIIPNTDLAQAAGLECEGGIVVDACGRTADPRIVAAGDCTATRLADGRLRRLESVQNAVEQGKAAAAALMGREKPFLAPPWFWSDQYDVKLQMVGQSAGHDRVVVRGSVPDGKFTAFYYREGRLIGMDSANRAQDHMAGRKLIDRGITPTPEQAADEGFALNALVA